MPTSRGQNVRTLMAAFRGGTDEKAAAAVIVVDLLEAQELEEGGGIIGVIETVLETGISTPDAAGITAGIAGKIVDLFGEV